MPEGVYFEAFIAMLTAYLFIGTLIALVSRRYGVKTTSEYFAAGHRLGGLLSAMTYAATTYSAFMMIGLVGLAYATGVGSLGFELSYLIVTLLLLSLLSRRVWLRARKGGWVSASEMISELYGSRWLGPYVALIYLVALVPYTSAQFIGVGRVFEGLGMSYGLGIAFAFTLVLLWLVIAGMWSKATTDLYQGLWMIAAAVIFISWLVMAYIPSKGFTLGMISNALTKAGYSTLRYWSLTTFLAFTIPWWFFSVTNPQVVRKLFMPADERSLKAMIKYFSIYGFAYTLIVVFIGLAARGLTLLGAIPKVPNRDLVTPLLLTRIDPITSSFIYVSLIAAAVTTANSIILSVTASFVRDFYERLRTGLIRGKPIYLANTIVVLLTLAVALVAYMRPSFIVEMSVLSSLILLPLAPVTIGAWLLPEKAVTRLGRNLSEVAVVAGTLIPLLIALWVGPRKALTLNYLGIPISGWLLIGVTITILPAYLINVEGGSSREG